MERDGRRGEPVSEWVEPAWPWKLIAAGFVVIAIVCALTDRWWDGALHSMYAMLSAIVYRRTVQVHRERQRRKEEP